MHGLATGQESRQRYRTNLRIEQSACAGHMYFQAAGIRVSASTTSSATRAGSSHCVKKLAPGMVTILIWEQAASVSRSDSLTPPSPLSPCTTQAGTPAAHNRGATERWVSRYCR